MFCNCGCVQAWAAGPGWPGPAVYVLLVIFRLFVGLSSHFALIPGGLVSGALEGVVWASLGLVLSALLLYFVARIPRDEWVRAAVDC